MLQKQTSKRLIKFLICGAITAAFNVALIAFIIEKLHLTQPLMRNIANLISIEISMLFSFWIYRTWVWSDSHSTLKSVIYQQMPRYHLSCGFSVVARSLLIFPLLDWVGIGYVINTLIGIAIGSTINYVANDRWVFKSKQQ